MTSSVDALLERFLRDQHAYEKLVEDVSEDLRDVLWKKGIRAVIDGRTKSAASFVRKVLTREYEDPFAEINDRAGVRVVVAHSLDVTRACAAIEDEFVVTKWENKADTMAPNILGYLGIHYEIQRGQNAINDPANPIPFLCEIQVHTNSQHAWSELSHGPLYKPVLPAPISIQRALYRLVALSEVFDSEAAQALKQLAKDESYESGRALSTLEELFLPLARRDYDRELSLIVLDVVLRAYTAEERSTLPDRIASLVADKADIIQQRYAEYDQDPSAPLLLFQPEGLAILERLVTAPEALKAAWTLDQSMLERLALVWGLPIE